MNQDNYLQRAEEREKRLVWRWYFGGVDMLLGDFRTLNASPKLELGQQPGAAPSRSWEPAHGAGAGGTRSLSLPCSERIL